MTITVQLHWARHKIPKGLCELKVSQPQTAGPDRNTLKRGKKALLQTTWEVGKKLQQNNLECSNVECGDIFRGKDLVNHRSKKDSNYKQ